MNKLFISFVTFVVSLTCLIGSQLVQAQSSEIHPTTLEPQAAVVAQKLYFPIAAKHMVPPVPTLNAIENSDKDGNYTLSWTFSDEAESYHLQVATSAVFSNAATIYEGPNTAYTASNQSTGVYYYRVAAANTVGNSAWSNIQSATVTPPTILYSIADATVLQGLPNLNAGKTVDMWTGYDHCVGAKISRGLVQFDLSAIPVGTAIARAQLHFVLDGSCDLANRAHTITIHPATAAWAEYTVTWNSQPGSGDEMGRATVQSQDWGKYSLDVTELVTNWVNGVTPNHGIVVRGPEESGNSSAMLAFLTREAGANYVPYIELTYATAMANTAARTAPVVALPAGNQSIHDMLSDVPTERAVSPYTWQQNDMQ